MSEVNEPQPQGEQLDAHTVIAVQRNRIMELEDNLVQMTTIANQYKNKYNMLLENDEVKKEGTE